MRVFILGGNFPDCQVNHEIYHRYVVRELMTPACMWLKHCICTIHGEEVVNKFHTCSQLSQEVVAWLLVRLWPGLAYCVTTME